MDFWTDSDGLKIYLAEIDQYPILSRERENELAIQYRDSGDSACLNELVTSNLRFVIKVALGYKNYGVKVMDLIQEGNLGLIKAVERFDPDKGYRLISYAVWWIKAYIQNHIIKSWSMVKMGTTQAQRKLFYRIGDLPDASDADLHFDNVTKLADKINVTEDEVFDMWSRLKSRDLSLDDMLGENSRDSFTDTLRDESMNQELALAEIQEQMSLQDWASRALDTLSSRERYIIQKRILSDQPETLKDLGEHFGVTRERARQIERAALQKLKGNYLHSDLAAA